MGVLILAERDDTYNLAKLFVAMGVPTVYYQQGEYKGELDENDVVRVPSWRPHITGAHLVITDSPALLLSYKSINHAAPALYISRSVAQMRVPPEANDYLLALMLGQGARPKRLGWWRRNGLGQ